MRGQGGLLPDGVGRQRPQRRAPRPAPDRHLVDPTLPYDPDFRPPEKVDPKARPIPVSRPNFVELCERGRRRSSRQSTSSCGRTSGCRSTGTHTYTHDRPRGDRRPASAGSCACVDRDLAYRVRVADAVGRRLPDRGRPGRAGGPRDPRRLPQARASAAPTASRCWIDTTRPELLPACVALVAHPDDERYQPLFGQTATTPLFGVEVPIVAHELADPEKGTGIAMICTFGDTTDVTWWRELGAADLRAVVQRDGRLRPVTWGEPGWESTDPGRRPGRLRRAGRQDGQAGPGPHRRAAHRGRRSSRASPGPSPTR